MRRPRRLIVLLVLAAACSTDDPTGSGSPPTVPAGCTGVESPKILGGQHIPEGRSATYNTTPPTSGNHYARWAGVDIYSEPIPDEHQVHNLEHGHVMIQYRGLTDGQINRLEKVVEEDPKMLLLAPYPDMEPAVALTSWGKIQTCDAWDDGIEALARRFIDENRDHAPESIP